VEYDCEQELPFSQTKHPVPIAVSEWCCRCHSPPELVPVIAGRSHSAASARLIPDAETAEPGNCALTQRCQFHEKLFRAFCGADATYAHGDHEHAL
jgi:hypothetical protein